MEPDETREVKVTLNSALDIVGFGLYSYLLLVLTGMVIMSYSCIVFSNTVLIPISSCDLKIGSFQQGLLVAMPSIGAILGALFWGYLGDTHGRRRMLLTSLFLGATTNALSSLSVNWFMLIVVQFIASVLVSGQQPLSMTLLSECVPVDKRNLAIILVTSIYLFSQGLMAVIAMPIAPLDFSLYMPHLGIYWTPWRAIMLIYSTPSLVCFIWMFFMQESPKYVFINKDDVHALKVLKVIHRVNNLISGEPFEVTGLIQTTEQPENMKSDASFWTKLKPFFKKPLRCQVILVTLLYSLQFMWVFKVWLPTIANQFMIIMDTGSGSDLTICRAFALSLQDQSEGPCKLKIKALSLVLAVCVVQAIANIVLSLLIKRVGRRNLVIIITSVCGVCGIFVNVIPNAIASASLFTVQMVGMICTGYYTAIAVSLFPTAVRAMGVTIAVTANRLSMFIAIQILNYQLQTACEMGFFIFCGLFTLSSMIATLLPDERKSARRLSFSPGVVRHSLGGRF
ncbi:uncharacterized protein LOC106136750 [Amyelois transitella]|uniref:uncharacterized protein LOC106136750 n=1 Tax=Amyelois transitella TaxID=680683 RepID=UPI00067E11E4|nr:uncharacterized protein LOC106136750 [Amyelois transitella]